MWGICPALNPPLLSRSDLIGLTYQVLQLYLKRSNPEIFIKKQYFLTSTDKKSSPLNQVIQYQNLMARDLRKRMVKLIEVDKLNTASIWILNDSFLGGKTFERRPLFFKGLPGVTFFILILWLKYPKLFQIERILTVNIAFFLLRNPIIGIIIPIMKTKTHEILYVAILKLLHPLVRILLRNNVPFRTFSDLAKRVYVDVATEEFSISGRKQTDSRVSVITGLTRKEVHRIKKLPEPYDGSVTERYHRAARVISGWVRDSEFLNISGEPTDLPLEGEEATFSALVKKFSGDMPARAVLDELLRVSCVTRLENGHIHLKTRAYIQGTEESEKLDILGTDVRDLIATIDHNLTVQKTSYFQRKVEYDNLPEEAMEKLRVLSVEQGQYLLEGLDRWMAQHDRDTNPAVKGIGRKRAGLGIYYFEEDLVKGEKS